MLKRLKAKNFRKLVDAELTFGPGLTAVRGANEAGKSTLLEAVAYALHGAKACRESMEDVVTWGEPKNSVKVELDVVVDGVTYVVKRSPSGAEVWFSGRDEPDVVGQTEVTNFMSRILGMDAAAMARLVFASQGGIRGALEEGPTATAEMIEKLADLTQIDDVIQLIVEHLPTGSAAGVEARLAQLQEQMADLRPIEQQDWQTLKAQQQDLIERHSSAAGKLSTKVDELKRLVAEKLRQDDEAKQQAIRRSDLQTQRETVLKRIAALQTTAQQTPIDTDTISQEIENLANLMSEVRLYEATAPYLPIPEVHWEGSRATFEAEAASIAQGLERVRVEISDVSTRIQVLKAQRVSSSVCGFCNQDVSSFPEVAAKNLKIDQEVEQFEQHLVSCNATLKALNEDHMAFTTLVAAAGKRQEKLARADALGKLTYDDSTYPPGAKWVGPIPDEAAITTLPTLQKRLKEAQERNKEINAAALQLPVVQENLTRISKELESMVPISRPADLEETDEQLDVALQALRRKTEELTLAQKTLASLEADEANEAKLLAMYEQSKTNLSKQIAHAKAEIEEIGFNNELLKAVRAARPVVAEAVWNMVLSAVSLYFSELRQEECIVQRAGKVFTVNGKGIGGLSGSTKDILGLAIRLSLTKTFLPNASFLLLDEISAACDPERTAVMLGFLQSTGIPQTILVTHEVESEAVADNLIQL